MKLHVKAIELVVGVAVTTVLTACGGSTGIASILLTSPTVRTTAEAINLADKNGALPALNRDSTDSTVAGLDANANGVRDDLDTYIAALPDTNLQKSALSQMSASLGKAMLVDTTNQSAMLAASKEIAAAAACLYARYDSSVASNKSKNMKKLTINTRIRFNAYDKFNAALNGTTFAIPQGNGCKN